MKSAKNVNIYNGKNLPVTSKLDTKIKLSIKLKN